MNTERRHPVVSWLWKIPAIALAYFFGVIFAGAAITAAQLPWPKFPGTPDEATNLILGLVSSFLMAVCLALLARGIRGSHVARWLILAAFTYVTFGLNNQIEAAIFTTYGGTATMLLLFILPCALAAAAAVRLFRPRQTDTTLENAITGRSVSRWWWRAVVAWLSFPVIYVFFGMLASPFVVPVYERQDFGLRLPGFDVIIPVALVRSGLYLAVTIPLLVNWSRSRRSLILALGVAYFAMMGLIGLVTATFFPPVLRIAHSVEILGDGFLYAWLLVVLFISKVPHEIKQPVAAVAD